MCWGHGGGEARAVTASPMKSLPPGALGRAVGANGERAMQRPQAGCMPWHMSQSGVAKRWQRRQVALVRERQRSHGMGGRAARLRRVWAVLCPMPGRCSTHVPPLETSMRRAVAGWWQQEGGRRSVQRLLQEAVRQRRCRCAEPCSQSVVCSGSSLRPPKGVQVPDACRARAVLRSFPNRGVRASERMGRLRG